MERDKLDMLISSSLIVTDEPEPALIQRIKQATLGPARRSRKTVRSIRVVAITIIIALIVTGTAIAAGQLLLPQDVAKKYDDLTLSAAFESEDAVYINESQTSGGYIFTLLGIVSGAKLTDYPSLGDTIAPESTFAVIAIQNEDGTPIPDDYAEDGNKQDFFISPFIKGEKPWRVNVFSMKGGRIEFAVDGVRYGIVECDDMSVFADRGVYICATDGSFYNIDAEAYIYHDKTGEISPNPEYDGPNALFSLPLDKSKADTEKAAQALKRIRVEFSDEYNTSGTVITDRSELDAIQKQIEDGDLVLVEGSVKELPNDDGTVSYSGTYKGSEFEGTYLLRGYQDEIAIENGGIDSLQNPYLQIISKDKNGVIYGKLYAPK